MTLEQAKSILTRNGFTPDDSRSFETPERVYAASKETIVLRGCSLGTPRAEVSWGSRLGIVCRCGNLPIE